jgi:chloramphenicol-sensitive protein RarD
MSDGSSPEIRTPMIAGLSAYLLWGVSPLFFQLLDFASAAEIVMHRVIWGVVVLAGVLAVSGKLKPAFEVFRDRKAFLTLLATAALISVNWWIFIYSVNNGQVLQASLGYYINPLLSVAVGVIVLREPLGPWRITAISLAALGVLNLTIASGSVPWLSLALAVSFTAYGYLRKTVAVDGRIGLFWETVFILPVALAGLVWLSAQGGGHFMNGPSQAMLLFLGGGVTVVPLLLYIIGARGLRLSTMGVMQFTAPTIQFIIGILAGEAFTTAHMITFALIWGGVLTFTWSQLRRQRRKPAISAGE